MATILLFLAVVVVSAACLLARGPRDTEDSADRWDAAPAGHPVIRTHALRSPATPPKGKHGDRRYHDVDYPCHRRRTDGLGGEM